MTIKSHVDPCLFIVFLHIKHDNIDADLADEVTALKIRHGQSFQPVWEQLEYRSRQIIFHEIYHYWQGLRLPFLFRYATLSYREMFKTFRDLSIQHQDFHQWSCFLPEMERLNLKSKIGFSPGGKVFWGGLNATFPKETTHQFELTPLYLLECAASLAEFQMSTERKEQLTDPLSLKRWAKRNPAYLEPFDFVAHFLESESLALRMVLPLINASFHTTWPERAFLELLAPLWRNFVQKSDISRQFLAQPEPCRWSELFQMWLGELQYEADPDSCFQIMKGCKYYRLTLDKWVFFTFGTKGLYIHPFIGPVARRWCEAERTRPDYSSIIDQPRWVKKDTFWECVEKFYPPISVFRFHMGHGRDRVIMHGTGDISGFTSFEKTHDPQYHGFIADLLAMYGAVRRASGAHFDDSQRICYHNGCSQFESNFCNSYVIIPDLFDACGFPQRMERLITLWRNTYVNDKD